MKIRFKGHIDPWRGMIGVPLILLLGALLGFLVILEAMFAASGMLTDAAGHWLGQWIQRKTYEKKK